MPGLGPGNRCTGWGSTRAGTCSTSRRGAGLGRAARRWHEDSTVDFRGGLYCLQIPHASTAGEGGNGSGGGVLMHNMVANTSRAAGT